MAMLYDCYTQNFNIENHIFHWDPKRSTALITAKNRLLELPDSLGLLRNLQRLDVSENLLSTLPKLYRNLLHWMYMETILLKYHHRWVCWRILQSLTVLEILSLNQSIHFTLRLSIFLNNLWHWSALCDVPYFKHYAIVCCM